MEITGHLDLAEGSARKRRPSLRMLGAVAAVAGLAAAILFAVMALTGGDGDKAGKLEGSSEDAFTLNYPKGWSPSSGEELDALPGRPLAVLRRENRTGLVMLRREGRAPAGFREFSSSLTRELDRRIPDFQKRTSRVVKIRAGSAFFYSYIRKRKGTVHTVLVVPAGNRSYALNTVSQGGDETVAREIARIILSFDA
jgi:hypothetical protein